MVLSYGKWHSWDLLSCQDSLGSITCSTFFSLVILQSLLACLVLIGICIVMHSSVAVSLLAPYNHRI